MTNNLPTIAIDTREQTPLVFVNLPTEKATLQTGDYSISGLEADFTIERKSIADLVQSVTFERERFERELTRMRGYSFRRLVVIGTVQQIEEHTYQSRAEPKAVLASLTAFEVRYSMPVCWCSTPTAAAVQIERWACYFLRERLKTAQDILARYDGTIQKAVNHE
jgi:DNA excision repair protein ERCC-4